MKRLGNWSVACGALLALAVAGGTVAAQEDAESENRQSAKVIARVGLGKHWIGVQTAPIDAALKSHLQIDDHVMIVGVVPDGPAAKAELQKYDIITQFGEHKIAKVEDLFKAVAASEGQEVVVQVLRNGKQQEVKLQPAERPNSIAFAPDVDGWRRPLEMWMRNSADGGPRFQIIGPGILAEADVDVALPGNLSVEVRKRDDQPAEITVKRDNEKWQVTEETLDELPENLRPHVKRFLGRRGAEGKVERRILLHEGHNGALQLFNLPPGDENVRPETPRRFEKALRQIEEMQRRLNSEDPFKALRQEIESLRQEIEQLQPGNHPSDDTPGDDADADDAESDDSAGTVDA